MQHQDTLTCLLSSVSSIPGIFFSDIKEMDIRRILEIYDNIGGKGTISGLVCGETGFGLLLIEGVLSAVIGNGDNNRHDLLVGEEESKEETLQIEESKNDDKEQEALKSNNNIPQYLFELVDRYGVALYCQNMAKEGNILGNFELKRTANRVLDLLTKLTNSNDTTLSSASTTSNILYKNKVMDLLNELKSDEFLNNHVKCQSVEGLNDQINQSMQLGYSFAFLLAQPSGVNIDIYTIVYTTIHFF